jgi:hypothetical protein
MWQLYVYSLLAGLIGAYGVPFFIKGILGHEYRTPFGNPSSAIVNVAWGWVCFVVALAFLWFADVHPHLLRAGALVAIGALISALLVAQVASQNKSHKKS